jgi:hypothetical protein
MPITLETLRVGDAIEILATPKNVLGEPCAIEDPSITTLLGEDDIVTIDSPKPLEAVVTAVAPGDETLVIGGRDSWDSEVRREIGVTVLDASALRLDVSAAENCALRVSKTGVVVVNVPASPEAEPTFVLTIVPVDVREGEPGPVSYSLSDGPNTVSTFGRILLNGNGAGVPANDDAVVTCAPVARGPETFTSTAVTANGRSISGSLDLLVVTASDFDYTATPQ